MNTGDAKETTIPPAEPLKILCRGCKSKLDVSDIAPFSKVPCPVCGTILRIPQRFDRYLLEKVCGIGGMSRIYRAIDPRLARRVAIKILTPESDPAEPEKIFFNEAKLVARLDHPGVVPIYQCGVCDDRPFLVMRFMAGGDMEYQMKHSDSIDKEAICRNLSSVAEALSFAFQKEKVVHHDIKPSNILLDENGDAAIADFDLADIREVGDNFQLIEEWGSPGYISPERLESGGEDHRGDIFSLGVSIYELLTRSLPFGIQGETQELYDRRQKMDFPPLNVLNPDVSGELSRLVSRMLSFYPEERPEYPEIIRILRREAGINGDHF